MPERKTVMLRRSNPGRFGRSVFDRRGGFVKRLTFEPGVPVTLSGRDLAAVEGDLGKALVEVELENRAGLSRPRIKTDLEKKTDAILQRSREQEEEQHLLDGAAGIEDFDDDDDDIEDEPHERLDS